MEKRYCAFLRGVNVKGTSMKMDDLKAAFVKMGFSDIKTILATGNVIFTTKEDMGREELKKLIERGIESYFQYEDHTMEAHIYIRDKEEIEEMLEEGKHILVPEGCHQYVLICDNKKISNELKEVFDSGNHEPMEEFFVLSKEAFWIVPKGSTLSSEFGSKVLGSKKYKSCLTSRNKNTLEKIYAAMASVK